MLTEGATLTVGNHNVTVVRYLSEGGFSKIYEVVMDPAEGGTTTGCLKQVLVPDKNGLNTLRKEVDVMKTLKAARSIVRYYDSHAERLPDGSYQVLVLMELCPNKSLLDYMNDRIRQKLTEPEILKILLNISIGIYEMHKLKLIHRDIKIENVLIDAKHNFKLCDFGSVSSPIRPPQGQQEFQMISHDILYNTTPQYRSPEMIDLYRGFPIDERSDIWALGCFLYKLCYFTTPFEAHGDIAILHASFQFPPAPKYSGDLKNLIIIMLQENPVYRPNIVQILMLLAKLLDVQFEKFDVEDFYGAGEYNFQALHEMQTEKHQQLLKQQQYYLEQQKQQQAYELSKKQAVSKNSSQASLSRISRQNSVPDADISLVSSNNDGEFKSEEENRSLVNEGNMSDSLLASNTTPKIPAQAEAAESPSDIEDLHLDLPELNNIAERFPSLDDLGQESGEPTGLDQKADIYNGKSSIDSTRELNPLENTVSRDPLDAHVTESSKSRTDLESADAWQQDSSPKHDDKTQKLADEIFAKPQRTKSSASSKSSRAPNKRVSEELARVGTPTTPRDRSRSRDAPRGPLPDDKTSQNLPSVRLTQVLNNSEPRANHVSQSQSIEEPQGRDIHVEEALDTNLEVSERKLQNLNQGQTKLDPKRASSNPWGSAIGTAVAPTSREPELNLPNQMGNLSLGSYFNGPAHAPAQENLIDFDEVVPVSNGIQKLSPTDTSTLPPHRVVEESLIDMNLNGNDALTLETKPSFKKRLSEMPTQPLNFEEQVVDFASDDENTNSEMNRVSIRKTLRKSRKSNETRRSDSSNADGRKRHSFFGGSSE